jgi:hypothetical protein
MASALARSRTVAWRPDSSMSRQRWARTMALTMVLSTRDRVGIHGVAPAGVNTCFAPTLVAQRDGDVHRHGATVFAQGGTAVLAGMYGCGAGHAASCVEPPLMRNSLQRDVSPPIRRCRSIPSGCRSTRSTNKSTMRACSAGNSSFQIGSNSRRAPRTSLSARVLPVLRAARQVWTMISGAAGIGSAR